MKKILLFLYLFSTLTVCAYAQTVVVLKNGKEVEGKMVEKTDEYIKINFDGVELTYWMDEIENISLQPELNISDDQQDKESSNTEDVQRIKDTIEKFYMGMGTRNVAAVMEQVSKSFGNSITDSGYIAFESSLKRQVDSFSKTRLSSSINNLKINILEINNNKAKAEVTYENRAFIIDSEEWINTTYHRYINVQKENGEWKIIQYYGDIVREL